MFPARQLAIAIWLAAAALLIVNQIYEPMRLLALFHFSDEQPAALALLANNIYYIGVIAGIGAIVHLLGEIRDAFRRRDADRQP